MTKGTVTLTKYEQARLIGARALQLAMGAPPLTDLDKVKKQLGNKYLSPVDLAEIEFEQNVIPMQVVRKTAA